MKNKLKRFFENEKIEYFSHLPYSACKAVRPDIMAREDFFPRSVIIFLVPYYGGECTNVSRYAASRDYHIYLKDVTNRLSGLISESHPDVRSKGYGDHSPIDERDAAAKASLGIIGDSGLLINEKYGSYVFIAELITDAEPSLFGEYAISQAQQCEHCGACRDSCPTARLSNPENICLSAITQKRGVLTDSESQLIRSSESVWGCDVCQAVCPHNSMPKLTPISFFLENRITELTEDVLSKMSDEEFSERAFAWRGRKTVLRNLEILKK